MGVLKHVDVDQRIAAWACRGINRLEFEPAPAALATHHQEPLADGPADGMFDNLDARGQAGDARQTGSVDVVLAGIVRGLVPGLPQGAENLFAPQQVGCIVGPRR